METLDGCKVYCTADFTAVVITHIATCCASLAGSEQPTGQNNGARKQRHTGSIPVWRSELLSKSILLLILKRDEKDKISRERKSAALSQKSWC